MKGFFRFLLLSIVVVSCAEKVNEKSNLSISENKDSLVLKYAKGFEVNYYKNHTEITVKHPENGNHIQTLIISDTSKIKNSLTSIFSSSTTHLAYLDLLQVNKNVTGFVNKDYIYNSIYLSQFESGETIDIGYGEDIDMEKLVSNKPEVFFISGLLGKAPQFERIEEMGIPLIEV